MGRRSIDDHSGADLALPYEPGLFERLGNAWRAWRLRPRYRRSR